MDTVLDNMKEYYGKEINSPSDLKTQACVTGGMKLPKTVRTALSEVHDEISKTAYGCGSPFSEALEGTNVLDLGCGTGRDVFACQKLIGPAGSVIGLDMTDEQLDVAREYQRYHSDKFGYANTEFVTGYIEDLIGAGIKEDSIDVAISNCVVNLSPDKHKVYQQVWNVLKEGGEMYFSDIYADQVVPKELGEDKVLWGEGFAGALSWDVFRQMVKEIGFIEVRRVYSRPVEIKDNTEFREVLGDIRFASMTVRIFKTSGLTTTNEDHGETATYLGGITDKEDSFVFDEHYTFCKGKAVSICSNTAKILKSSRFGKFFEFSETGEFAGDHAIQTKDGDFYYQGCAAAKCS